MTRLDGLSESFPQRVRRCWKGGLQLSPWVSTGSVIDCTAVAFNYDSSRSMQKAAGAKVTFLHSDYSRLLCGSAVLCLHPSAVTFEDRVLFLQVNRQGSKRMQVFLHLPSMELGSEAPSFLSCRGKRTLFLQAAEYLQPWPSVFSQLKLKAALNLKFLGTLQLRTDEVGIKELRG